jgi:hypothetical protein
MNERPSIEPETSLASIPPTAPPIGRGELPARSVGLDEPPGGSTTRGTPARVSPAHPHRVWMGLWISGVLGGAMLAGAWLRRKYLFDWQRALREVRAADAAHERELAILRADLERVRVEAERAAGARLP